MNKNSAYLVLSVRDIETLLAAALASAEAAGDNKSHCIIMRDIQLNVDRGCDDWQISSHDVTTRAEAVQAKAHEVLAARYPIAPLGYASQDPSTGITTVCMNHSDAAI